MKQADVCQNESLRLFISKRRHCDREETTSFLPFLKSKMASITSINLLALATSLPYAADITAFNSSTQNVTFQSYHDSFPSLLGSNASWTMIANETYQAFHEAGVYDQASKSLYISSNWAGSFENPINMSILNLEDFTVSSTRYPGLASPNGGCTYVPPGATGPPQLLFCDEGNFDIASGLTVIDPGSHTTKV
jgi:gluconolactonase